MEQPLDAKELYASYKPLLFSLAYRMLGGVMDAEDIVHEAFLSLSAAEPDRIRNVKAYLCKIVTNRCIDRLRSTQAQREVYVGPWLPEPLVTDPDELADDPLNVYLRSESLSTAYLLLLQQLSWTERAVFLLREVLQYDYGEISEVVGKSSANCRQIFHRAKRAVGERREPAKAPDEQTSRLVDRFVGALMSGNMGELLAVMSSEATLYSDGGGKVHAAVRPILGADRIIRFLAGLLDKMPSGFSFALTAVNGQPGIVTFVDRTIQSVISFHAEDDRFSAIYVVINPDKLTHVLPNVSASG